jgi:ligand-binding SRPBCC domain-containing protein
LKVFVYCSGIDAPSNEVFAWHCRDDAFKILDPPWRQPFIVREKEEEEALMLVMIVTLLFKCS